MSEDRTAKKEERSSRIKKSIVLSGLVGTGGLFIAKMLGLVYSIPLSSILGSDAYMSYYGNAYRIYNYILNICTAGFPLAVATVISCIGGMAFNIVADPLLGYYYKMYVLGVPQQAANIWAKMGAVTTAVNAVIAVVAATVFYLALRPALKRAKMLPQL